MKTDEISTLTAAYKAALELSRTNPTPETRMAVVAAGRYLSDALVKNNMTPKTFGYACRAGKRQHAEMRAMTAEAIRRQAIKLA